MAVVGENGGRQGDFHPGLRETGRDKTRQGPDGEKCLHASTGQALSELGQLKI